MLNCLSRNNIQKILVQWINKWCDNCVWICWLATVWCVCLMKVQYRESYKCQMNPKLINQRLAVDYNLSEFVKSTLSYILFTKMTPKCCIWKPSLWHEQCALSKSWFFKMLRFSYKLSSLLPMFCQLNHFRKHLTFLFQMFDDLWMSTSLCFWKGFLLLLPWYFITWRCSLQTPQWSDPIGSHLLWDLYDVAAAQVIVGIWDFFIFQDAAVVDLGIHLACDVPRGLVVLGFTALLA